MRTLFGAGIDKLARERGAWPPEAVVYMVEVIGPGQALLTGEVPVGTRKDGRPKFAPKKAKSHVYRAAVTSDEYHAAIRQKDPAP